MVTIEQPRIDKRTYRHVVLENGLKALICSDPETDKAAAAYNVHVGSFADPIELPGLAHYVEHMMSHGSTKYPDEAHYKQIVSQFGGSSNASTSAQNTVYKFSVNAPALESALDVFAQFFIEPLMDESAADREVNAVDSEHQKNLLLDSRRGYYLLKEAASEEHPFSRFSTGSLETLRDGPRAKGVDVRAALKKFHSEFYSSRISTLAVVGREPADVLESWVRRMFSAVPDTGIAAPSYADIPAFSPDRWNQRLEVVPVKDIRRIEVAFLLPPQTPLYRTKPTRYATHLIGHEGAGSLLSYFKGKGWADALSASAYDRWDDVATLTVGITLTKLGEGHVEECVSALFAYLRLLGAAPPERWIFDEAPEGPAFRPPARRAPPERHGFHGSSDARPRRSSASPSSASPSRCPRPRPTRGAGLGPAERGRGTQDKAAPYGYAEDLANQLQEYPPEHVLSGPSRLWEFDAGATAAVLAALRPERMRSARLYL
eukprot:tig00021070_g17911.t1